MNPTLWLSDPLWLRLGLTLGHFLWQGAAVALVLALVLRFCRRHSPQTRYLAGTAALAVLAVCPLATFSYLSTRPFSVPVVAPPPNLPPLRAAEVRPAPLRPVSDTLPNERALAPEPLSIEPPSVALDVASLDEDLPVQPAVAAAEAPAPIPVTHRTAAPLPVASPASPPRVPALPFATTRWLAPTLSAAAWLWMLGVALLSIRLIYGHLALRRIRRAALPLSTELERRARLLATRLGLRRARVCVSTTTGEPFALGLLRPMVLLPVSLVTHCPPEWLEAVLAHELAHIRRYDLWVNLAQRVVETLLFYHPAVWWVSGRIRMERELCCDDLAVQALEGRRAGYAEALVEVPRVLTHPPAPTPLAAGLIGTARSLEQRVRRVLRLTPPLAQSRFWPAGWLGVLFVASLALVGPAHRLIARESSPNPADGAALPAAAPTSAPSSTTQPAFAIPEVPPLPEQASTQQWSILTAELSSLEESLAKNAERLRRQQTILQEARPVLSAAVRLQQALLARDRAALRELFQPEGRPAANDDVEHLLADVDRLAAWFPGDDPLRRLLEIHGLHLVVQRGYAVVEMRLLLVAQAADQQSGLCIALREIAPSEWRMTKLYVVSVGAGQRTANWPWPNKLTTLEVEDALRSGEASVRDFDIVFDSGKPSRYTDVCYTALAPNGHALGSHGGNVLDDASFSAPFREWQAFTPLAPSASPGRAKLAGTPTAAATQPGASAGARKVAVFCPAAGVVAWVAPAKYVEKGDVLLRLDSAEIELDVKSAEARLAAANRTVDRLRTRLEHDVMPNELADAETALTLAELDLQRQQLRLARTVVRSEVAGDVTSVRINIGQAIDAGAVILQITPTSDASDPNAPVPSADPAQ